MEEPIVPKSKVRWLLGISTLNSTLRRNIRGTCFFNPKRKRKRAPEKNAEFVCKMEDVLDVYKRAYNEKFPVVCKDETTKQLTKETRITIPMQAGKAEQCDTE